MRILFIAPYITSEKHPAFLRNQTGFGYMVYDIAEYVGRTEHVELFAVNVIAPYTNMKGFVTVERNWFKFIRNFSIRSLVDAIKFIRKYKVPIKEKLRIIYQFEAISQAENIMKTFDVVHIHGCSPITDAAIKACRRKKMPFAVTLHGLVSFEKAVRLHDSLKQYEKDFLLDATIKNYHVSLISSGNKEAVESFIESKLSRKA